jgi:transposase
MSGGGWGLLGRVVCHRRRLDLACVLCRDAVRMMRNRGTRTVAEVADDLGVGSNLLHQWAAKLEKDAVAKRNVEGETVEQEVRRLRKEVEQLRMDKATLKKAAAFFAKDSE